MEGIRGCGHTAIRSLCPLKSPGTLSEMSGLGLLCFQVKLRRPLTVISEYKSWYLCLNGLYVRMEGLRVT